MTISKEERAELRELIEQAAMWPLPWEAHGDGYSDNLVFSANDAQEDYLAEFTGRHGCDLAVAAVNAAPKLLASLDAADTALATLQKRIAELEAAAQWRPMDTAPRDGSRVLVGNGRNSPVFARFIDRQWRSDERLGIVRPSHWLPIPALPEGGV